jgi:hypothetical protein
MLIKIHRAKKLEKYSKNKHMCRRIPNFKVKMGFGLNFGWAIEGPIGSKVLINHILLFSHNLLVQN